MLRKISAQEFKHMTCQTKVTEEKRHFYICNEETSNL